MARGCGGVSNEYKPTERDHREAALSHAVMLLRSEGIISESMEEDLDRKISDDKVWESRKNNPWTAMPVTIKRQKVFNWINFERHKQDAKWGADRKHHPLYWLAILVEEVGEFSKAIIERNVSGMREEGIQVGAVSTMILEVMDHCEEVLLDEIGAGKGQGDASRE